MKHLFKVFVVIRFVLALSTSAYALSVGTIPGGLSNEFIGAGELFPGPTIGGYFDAQVYLIGGPADILAEYYGAEAGFTNRFDFSDDNESDSFLHSGGDTSGTTVRDSFTLHSVISGILKFKFTVNGGAAYVENGDSNLNTSGLPNFFVSFNPYSSTAGGPTSGQSVWLFLDDAGGAGDDDNHDDMLVKLSITNRRIIQRPRARHHAASRFRSSGLCRSQKKVQELRFDNHL